MWEKWSRHGMQTQTFDLRVYLWSWAKLADSCLQHIVSVSKPFEPCFVKSLQRTGRWSGHKNIMDRLMHGQTNKAYSYNTSWVVQCVPGGRCSRWLCETSNVLRFTRQPIPLGSSRILFSLNVNIVKFWNTQKTVQMWNCM